MSSICSAAESKSVPVLYHTVSIELNEQNEMKLHSESYSHGNFSCFETTMRLSM